MEYSAKEQETEQKLDDLEMRVNNLTNQICKLKAEKQALLDTLELCNSLYKKAKGANNG